MDALGRLVREARDKRGETIKQMAKAIKCSEAFAKHIEIGKVVPISERLIEALKGHYSLNPIKLKKAASIRQKIGRAYYAKWRRDH